MRSPPAVLYPLTLPALLHHVLAEHGQPSAPRSTTTLVICTTRDAFVQQLEASLHDTASNSLASLIEPTLHNLSSSRHIKLIFCASVQALLAYLTSHRRTTLVHADDHAGAGRLVLVDCLALHAPTPSFSAQGLSRTFAAAAEMAHVTGAVLNLVECQMKRHSPVDSDHEDVDMSHYQDSDSTIHTAEEEQGQDPWDQDISILNVSARRFGSGTGERAWAGRSVKVKRVAARWFQFHKLDNSQALPGHE